MTVGSGKISAGGLCGQPADGIEHISARVGLSEIGGAARGFGFRASFGIVVRGDENEGRRSTLGQKLLAQLDAGHAAELDIEHEAIELRMFRVREKCLRRRIRDRLDVRRAQQPSERTAKVFVVIDDGDIDLFGAAHEQHQTNLCRRRR